MLVDIGERIHVIERRRFETEIRRHFFGEVDRSDGGAVRLVGYAFVFDAGSNTYVRTNGPRRRIVPLASQGFVINVVPQHVVVDEVHYAERSGRLKVTDGKDFVLDINEFGRSH